MKSFRKVSWIASLGAVLSKVSQQQVNRIADAGVLVAVGLLLGAEENARRTWRDRAESAQMALAGASVELSALRDAASQAKEVK